MPPKKQKPVNPLERIRKEQTYTRRSFLAVGTIASGGILASLLGLGKKKPKPVPVSKQVPKKPVVIKSEKRIGKPKPKPIPKPRQVLGCKVYKKGLSGKALADAYSIPHTNKVFDFGAKRLTQSTGYKALIHDIKVLVARECKRYNSICEINPNGKKLVDPYEVLAMIEQESHYNPNAHNPKANDRGLGQIVPIQEEHLKTLLKMPVVIKDFYDPAQNIHGVVRTVAWLVNHPANKSKQTTWRRFAAYNRGRGGAKNQIVPLGRQYANTVTAIWERLRQEKAFAGY